MSDLHGEDVDYSPKNHYRIEAGEDTTDGAFLTIAHPQTTFAGPEMARFDRDEARELYEKLEEVLDVDE